ncbi:hypothetical protein [Eubacterium sp.]|uniref:hypothetical protein n=1 Tax=Eubacterium sp. TaxID=142586 RepID=UPI0025E0A96D|nr:hypothetical protein [Eubacterium sp.]MCR5630300.1 hypothetical protein [Eubacterium sp.]
MRLDSDYYSAFIKFFDLCMNEIFGEQIRKIDEVHGFEYMGTFIIQYLYLPDNKLIKVENELRTFGIYIFDEDNAHNSLKKIIDFDDSLNEKNIKNALFRLKEVLKNKEYSLFYNIENRLYKKDKNGKIKRLKDINEMM